LASSLTRRAGQRGFSLIELIVVVIIISVLAVLAIPAITQRMRDRRTHEAAQLVANLYRDARMRSMGRGAAMLVRYSSAGDGTFQLREGRRGAVEGDPTCAALPAAGCLTNNWQDGAPDNVVVSTLNPASRSEYAGVTVTMDGPPQPPANGAAVNQMDVCFTPLGRVFVRFNNPTGVFQPLTGVPVARVTRKVGNSQLGLTRRVLLLPNGTARLSS
jgi:type IV fimbrial biogenesis protein FimT